MRRFGEILERHRKAAGVSRYAIATHLRLSESYLRDIERSRRAPLRPELIERAAEYLNAPAQSLLEAAAIERGKVEVAISCEGPRTARLAMRIAKVLPKLEAAELDTLEKTVGFFET